VNRSAYWALVTCLLVFGFITGFSIGAPFFLLGLTLAVLGPLRHHRRVIGPAVAAVIALSVGYVLFAPLTCSATSTASGESSVVCSSILGGPYSGTGEYNPPLEPALRAGAVFAVVAAMATWIALSSELRSRPSPTP
jgi:hypothetical protein